MARRFVLMALCAALWCVAASAQIIPHEYKCLFRGKVQDADGRAVSGVTVNYWHVLETPDQAHYTASTGESASTDVNGEFAFFGSINPNAIRRFLEFSHERFGFHLTHVEAAGAIFVPVDTALRDVPPLSPDRVPTITLPKRVAVRGTVLDTDGQPVAGAEVTPLMALQVPEGDKRWAKARPSVVVDMSPILKSTTTSDGSFIFPAMPPDVRFGLRAWHPDIALAYQGEAIRTSVEEPLLLTAADAPVTITMPQPASVTGNVVVGPGTTIPAGAVIRATHLSLVKTAPRVLPVDSAGNYDCEALAAGTYRFQFSAGTLLAPEPRITLAAGEHREVAALSAGPGARLSARVVDAKTGKPIRDAKLEWTVVHMEEGAATTQIETASGAFSYAVRPGMVALYARGLNFTALEETSEFQMVLNHGVETPELEIRAVPFRTISGQVLNPDGSSASGAKVYASENNRTIANVDGNFSLKVTARSYGESLRIGALSEGTPQRVGLVELPKESGDLDDVEIKLTVPATITGELVDENYQTLPSMPVSCSNAPLPSLFAFADEQGQFQLYPVLPNSRVFVNAFGPDNESVEPLEPGQTKAVGLLKAR